VDAFETLVSGFTGGTEQPTRYRISELAGCDTMHCADHQRRLFGQ